MAVSTRRDGEISKCTKAQRTILDARNDIYHLFSCSETNKFHFI